MLSLLEGVMGVVLNQLALQKGSSGERNRSPRAPRTQATQSQSQSQEESCLKCGAATTKAGNPLLRCSKCKTVKYCSPDCQKKDWKKHKQMCKQVQEKGKQAQMEDQQAQGEGKQVQDEGVGDDKLEAMSSDEAKA